MAAEKQFENKVKAFLKSKGCWSLKYWGGGSNTKSGAVFTKSGIPDLLVCCNGRFVAVELKAPKGRPSDLQLYNLRKIDHAGGYAVLLYPDDYALFQNLVQCIQVADQAGAEHIYNSLKSKWNHFENKNRKGE